MRVDLKLWLPIVLCLFAYVIMFGRTAHAQPLPDMNITAQKNSAVTIGNNNNTTLNYNTYVGGASRQYAAKRLPQENKKFASDIRPKPRKLMVTEAYLLPNHLFFKKYPPPSPNDLNDIAFLFAEIKSLSPMPILITSVDFKIEGTKGIISGGGSMGQNILATMPSNASIFLHPGEVAEIKFSRGVKLKSLSQYIDLIGIRDEFLFADFKPPRTTNDFILTRFNNLLSVLYGSDASLLVSFYENDRQLVHQVRLYIAQGADFFFQGERYEGIKTPSSKHQPRQYGYTTKLSHDAFLGEYLRLLTVHDKAFKLKEPTVVEIPVGVEQDTLKIKNSELPTQP